MKKIVNIILIITFLGLITFPLVFADFPGGDISSIENRYLANFPIMVKDGAFTLTGFRQGMENWINDNAGARSLASEVNAQIQFELFDVSTKSDVIVGKDNWLFYYTDNVLNDFTGNNLPSDEQLAIISSNIQTINDFLDNKGIMLETVLIPDKKTIYAELYPDGIGNPIGTYRTDLVINYINDRNNSIHLLDGRQALLNAKTIGTLYSPRNDYAHWNSLGAFVGYQAICEDLHQYFSNIRVININNCKIDTYAVDSLFYGAVPVSELDYHITTGLENTFKSEPQYLDQFPFLNYNGSPETYKKHYVNNDSTLPKILIIGDSYTQRMFEYFPQSFSEVTFMHSSDLEFLPDVVDTIKPDVVVIESVERMLDFEFGWLQTCSDKIKNIVS